MTLEGANNFFENENIVVYTMNGAQTGQYCAVIPKNLGNAVSMMVDINMKALFDSLINNSITKEQLIEKIVDEYKVINNSYSGSILVLPMLDMNVLGSAVNSGDKQKMFDETKKIGGITSELYKKLTESGIDKSRVSQKIIIVENSDIDVKFVEWLKAQMPNFVDGVSLEELKGKVSTSANNPFENVNPFTGEANSTTEQASNDIFGNNVSNNIEAPVDNVKSNDTFDIFGSQAPMQSEVVAPAMEPTPITPVSEPVPPVNNNVNPFEPQPVQSVSLNNEPVSSPAPATVEVPNASGVSPVDSSVQSQPVLDSPVVNENVNNVNENTNNVNELDKKSGGFANLLILAVILVVVTVISIELGKYLYNVFGV